MTYPEMAADVAGFIKRHNLFRPAIIGHSMGGKTTMALAQNHLAAVSKLVIADIAPVRYDHSHDEFVTAMRNIDFSQVNSRGDVDKQLSQDIANTQVRQFLLQNLEKEDDRYQWRINLDAIAVNMPALLDYRETGVCNAETLFIAGSLSAYISRDYHHRMRQLFPSAYIESIADAGHWLHAEQPEKFVTMVRHFLAGN